MAAKSQDVPKGSFARRLFKEASNTAQHLLPLPILNKIYKKQRLICFDELAILVDKYDGNAPYTIVAGPVGPNKLQVWKLQVTCVPPDWDQKEAPPMRDLMDKASLVIHFPSLFPFQPPQWLTPNPNPESNSPTMPLTSLQLLLLGVVRDCVVHWDSTSTVTSLIHMLASALQYYNAESPSMDWIASDFGLSHSMDFGYSLSTSGFSRGGSGLTANGKRSRSHRSPPMTAESMPWTAGTSQTMPDIQRFRRPRPPTKGTPSLREVGFSPRPPGTSSSGISQECPYNPEKPWTGWRSLYREFKDSVRPMVATPASGPRDWRDRFPYDSGDFSIGIQAYGSLPNTANTNKLGPPKDGEVWHVPTIPHEPMAPRCACKGVDPTKPGANSNGLGICLALASKRAKYVYLAMGSAYRSNGDAGKFDLAPYFYQQFPTLVERLAAEDHPMEVILMDEHHNCWATMPGFSAEYGWTELPHQPALYDHVFVKGRVRVVCMASKESIDMKRDLSLLQLTASVLTSERKGALIVADFLSENDGQPTGLPQLSKQLKGKMFANEFEGFRLGNPAEGWDDFVQAAMQAPGSLIVAVPRLDIVLLQEHLEELVYRHKEVLKLQDSVKKGSVSKMKLYSHQHKTETHTMSF